MVAQPLSMGAVVVKLTTWLPSETSAMSDWCRWMGPSFFPFPFYFPFPFSFSFLILSLFIRPTIDPPTEYPSLLILSL